MVVDVLSSPKTSYRRVDSEVEYSLSEHGEGKVRQLVIFQRACEWCQKGKRDCEVEVVAVACTGCKMRKYKCNHMGKMDLKTMTVTRAAEGSELEVPDLKGNKRQAELPVPAQKRKTKVKEVKEVKVKVKEVKVKVKEEKEAKGKKVKVKVEKVKAEKAKAGGSNLGKQRAHKSAATVSSTELEAESMESEEEPKHKHAQRVQSK